MDFSFVYKLLGQISSSEQQNKELFEAFKMCFDFEKTDQISFDELQTIFLSGNYKSLKLEHWILYFNEAFKIGIRNYEVFHHEKLKDSSLKYELIDFGNKTEVSNLSIENSMDRYIAFFKDEISGNSSQSFLLTILSDEGDLYTYQVAPYMPLLYQFVKELDRSYKITKEKTFTEIDWDCYENKPILTNWLDKSIIENDNYQILSFDVKKENIHIRMQKAESVHVKWEESIDLVIFIQDLISSLVYNEEADWSTVSKKFEEIPIDKQKKQQMYRR